MVCDQNCNQQHVHGRIRSGSATETKTTPMNRKLDLAIIEHVSRFYDLALKHARPLEAGFWGGSGHLTPMFADALYLEEGKPAFPLVERADEIYSNVALQGNMTRAMRALSALAGERKYHIAALQAMSFFLKHHQNPNTRLLPWGGHLAVNLSNGLPSQMQARPSSRLTHELKAHFPDLPLMIEANREATVTFAMAQWENHVVNKDMMNFSRHAEYLGLREAEYERFTTQRRWEFLNAALDMIVFFIFLHREMYVNRQMWLDRALRLLAVFDGLRSPRTGWGRSAFIEGEDVKYFDIYEITRYQVCASACCHIGEDLGKAGRPFIEFALKDLRAFARYAYDEKTRGFFIRRKIETGERLKYDVIREEKELSGYPLTSTAAIERKNDCLPSLYYSYAIGHRLTKDETLEKTLDRITDMLELNEPSKTVSLGAEAAAFVINGLMEQFKTGGRDRYLKLAAHIAEMAMERYTREDGFFIDWPESPISRVTSRLPLALLRLGAVLRNESGKVDRDMGGGTYLDPDPIVRWRYERHSFRISSENVMAVIGDSYPHKGALQGTWKRAGVHALGLRNTPGKNIFADGFGGLVFAPLEDLKPCHDFTALGDDAVLMGKGAYLETSAGKKACVFKAAYRTHGNQIDAQAQFKVIIGGIGRYEAFIPCSSYFNKSLALKKADGLPVLSGKMGGMRITVLFHTRNGTCDLRLEPDEKGVLLLVRWIAKVVASNAAPLEFYARIILTEQDISPQIELERMRKYVTSGCDILSDPKRRQIPILINY